MAWRAFMKDVEQVDIDASGNIAMNVMVKYTDYTNQTEDEYAVNVQQGWPTLLQGTGPLHTAIRDAIIAAQPSGYNLATGDVIITSFVRGNVL